MDPNPHPMSFGRAPRAPAPTQCCSTDQEWQCRVLALARDCEVHMSDVQRPISGWSSLRRWRSVHRWAVWFFSLQSYIQLWCFNFLLKILHCFPLRNHIHLHEDSSTKLGKFLRYYDLNLSLKYYIPQVPALLSELVLYILIASFLFLLSKQHFFSASIYFQFPLDLWDSFSLLYVLHIVLRPPHLLPFTDGVTKTTPELTSSRSSHPTSPFAVSLLSVTFCAAANSDSDWQTHVYAPKPCTSPVKCDLRGRLPLLHPFWWSTYSQYCKSNDSFFFPTEEPAKYIVKIQLCYTGSFKLNSQHGKTLCLWKAFLISGSLSGNPGAVLLRKLFHPGTAFLRPLVLLDRS